MRLTNYFPGDVGVSSDSAENMNRVDGNVKKVKEKRERKSDLLKSVPQQANPSGDQDIDNGIKALPFSVGREGRMEHDTKENNNNVIQKHSMLTQDPKDAICDNTLGKKIKRSKIDSDSQSNFPIDKDHAHMDKEQKKSTSQTKPHSESKNYDGSINGKTDPNSKSVRNLVKSFSMSPPASSDSTQCTQNVRHRVVVWKVPRKRNEQTDNKSKKDRGPGAIFNDAISEGSDDELGTVSKKAAIETSSDDSSTSADSGISSAAYDGSGVLDDDGNASLSQKSLKEGLHIGSILRGSCSYKKARQKQAEQLDDDTEVPDS